jgi:hypothetical protein
MLQTTSIGMLPVFSATLDTRLAPPSLGMDGLDMNLYSEPLPSLELLQLSFRQSNYGAIPTLLHILSRKGNDQSSE